MEVEPSVALVAAAPEEVAPEVAVTEMVEVATAAGSLAAAGATVVAMDEGLAEVVWRVGSGGL